MARAGRTVITTIHQPNSDIYTMFDRIMLMANGRIIYFNESNKSERFFAQTGYPVPELMNPCDHYLSITSIENLEEELEDENDGVVIKGKELERKYHQGVEAMYQSYINSDLVCDVEEVHEEAKPLDEQKDVRTYNANWCK